MCGTSIEELAALVEHLLRRTITAERFDMLETIREFASTQLEHSGEEEAVRRRHAAYYLALADEALPAIERGQPEEALERLAVEHDNLRAALHTYETLRDTQGAQGLSGALWPFWMVRGHVPEARRALGRALEADARPTAARARALIAAAQLTAVAGPCDTENLEVACSHAEEALRLFVETDDPSGAALARWVLAWLAERAGEWVRALDLFEAGVNAFRALADDHFVLVGEAHRALLYEQLGEHHRARSLHNDNLRQARSLGNQRVEALTLGALATYAIADGRLDDAWEMVATACAIHQTFGFAAFLSVDLIRFAAILARNGEPAVAAQLAARAARLTEELTAVDEPWTARERSETTALIRTQLGEATFAEAWSHGWELNLDDAFVLVSEFGRDVDTHGQPQ